MGKHQRENKNNYFYFYFLFYFYFYFYFIKTKTKKIHIAIPRASMGNSALRAPCARVMRVCCVCCVVLCCVVLCCVRHDHHPMISQVRQDSSVRLKSDYKIFKKTSKKQDFGCGPPTPSIFTDLRSLQGAEILQKWRFLAVFWLFFGPKIVAYRCVQRQKQAKSGPKSGPKSGIFRIRPAGRTAKMSKISTFSNIFQHF